MTQSRISTSVLITLAAGLVLQVACGGMSKESPVESSAEYAVRGDSNREARAEAAVNEKAEKKDVVGEVVMDSEDDDAASSLEELGYFATPAPTASTTQTRLAGEPMLAISGGDAAFAASLGSKGAMRKRQQAGGTGGLLGYRGDGVGTGSTVPRAESDAVFTPPPPAGPSPHTVRPSMDPPVPELPAHLAEGGEEYKDYGVNNFNLVSKDRLSTFAIDVDTASYTMTRKKLNNGYLPSYAGVRVEEFVNYFDYEYKQPASGSPFAVDIEASPSPWNSMNHIVRIGVQGKRVAYDKRKPVHLTFLVDTSGSMNNTDKIGLVKKTLKMLTEELEDGDTVAIATYAGSTQIVLEPTPMSQKRDIIRALDRMMASGSTAMASGMDLAYQLADATFVEGAVNRVIVCSDGDANVGRTSHQQISEKIRGYAQKGITLTTVGFGNGNYKDTMMERLANDGDGNYYYIDSELEARRVFVDQLSSTMEVIAKDVKIQVEWNPEDVIAYRLIGYENRDVADKDFRNDAVDAGEIGAGHQVTALYEVVLSDTASGDVATVRVRSKAPGADSPAVERSFSLKHGAIRGTFAETTDQYRIAFASASFAEILRDSPHVQEVSLRQVQEIARGAARPEYAADAELVELIGTAARLKGENTFSQR